MDAAVIDGRTGWAMASLGEIGSVRLARIGGEWHGRGLLWESKGNRAKAERTARSTDPYFTVRELTRGLITDTDANRLCLLLLDRLGERPAPRVIDGNGDHQPDCPSRRPGPDEA